jgi:hypothetical protein
MKSAPVRVKARTHQVLKQIAKHRGTPVADVIDDAVERYRRLQLFEAADAAYRKAQGKNDPELLAWQNALADGLPEE